MHSRTLSLLFQTLALTTIAIVVNGQFPRSTIEFLAASNNVPGQGTRYRKSQPVVQGYIQTSKKLCIQGGWALYNKPNYGENNLGDKDLNVISLRSSISPTDCIDGTAVENALKTTFSIRALAAAGSNEIEIYRYKNFLSESTAKILVEAPTAAVLARTTYESFVVALNTTADDVSNYIVCGQEGNCICVDEGNSPLVVRDVTQFPRSRPLMRLSRFDLVSDNATIAECERYPNPTF